MAEKVLRTKIALLYKTYEEWDAIKESYKPLKGEVCICEVPAETGAVVEEPAVLIKVGDGQKSFKDLPWLSGLAADIYAWAKKEDLDFADLSEEFKEELEKFISQHAPQVDTKYQIVEDGEGAWKLQKNEGSGWVDATGRIDINSLLAKKVDKQIVGPNGLAEIFNEQDGGGAHFIHEDGTESFVGVNDGGEAGLMAQIYADKQVGDQWVGSRINVYHNGIYYVSKAHQLEGFAKNAPEMEIATKKDIADIGKPLHFIGIATKQEGESEAEAIEREFPIAEQTIGAVAICGNKEFVAAGEPLAWKEFGDVSQYATKAELEAEIGEVVSLIAAEETRAKAEEAKKVDKVIESADGKAYIFNEVDGGGAKFEHVDGTESFVGVNNGGEDGIAAQIYADKLVDGKWQGAKLDVTNNGIYYTVGSESAAERDVEANELATKGDIDAKVGTLADIAHSGMAHDLLQEEDEYLILDCNL